MISLGAVNISKKTKLLLNEALDKGIVGQGKYIKDFEEGLANFLGVKHAIAVANGTLADAVALASVKVQDGGQRDEVIVPALTFIAQINAVYYNHLKPVFIDANYDYEIDADKIEEKITEKTLAIMPTHILGRPADMKKINALVKKHHLFVIEDSCEALGSRLQDQLCGTMGDMGCFSFYVSHSITTGEGGAIVTNDDALAERARSLRNHGRQGTKPGEHYLFPHIGFSAKMNAMEAIVGLGIIDELSKYIEKRHQNVMKMNALMDKNWFAEKPGEYIVPHGYPVMAESEELRNELLKILPEKYGIEARQIFYSIPTQSGAYKFLGEKEGSYPVAEDIGKKGLYVPCHQNLADKDLIEITDALKQALK